MTNPTHLKLSTLISEEKLKVRIKEIGKELTERFKDESVIAIGVLKGSFIFFADLIREVDTDVQCEFLGVSSYTGTKSSGEVKLTLDLANPIEGRHVILIEDIVDTGLTMNYLIRALESRKPKSLTTVALLYKPEALKVKCTLDHYGFEIQNEFVVGYGLDYQGNYRNLPYVARVENMN